MPKFVSLRYVERVAKEIIIKRGYLVRYILISKKKKKTLAFCLVA